MKSSVKVILVAAAAAVTLSACGSVYNVEKKLMMNGQYWQRKDATSALWLQGPKAQQTLNRDISRCVVEIRELERLGTIKSATPAEEFLKSVYNDDPRNELLEWDSPERDGYRLLEGENYHDFETCMISKGWERTQYVPYDVSKRSAKDYMDTHVALKHKTMHGEKPVRPSEKALKERKYNE